MTAALRRIGGWLSAYRVVIAVGVALSAAALWARAALDPDASSDVLARFGYGLTAFEAGRWWTVFTGFPLQDTLTVWPLPLVIVALFLCERLASHWRTLVVFVGGHVAAVLATAGLLWVVENSSNEWVWTMARALDVGSSNGAFACLGAWTAYLSAPTRRRARVGIGCYLAIMLLFTGHIYDLSHALGWCAGLAVGRLLTRGSQRRFDQVPFRSRELGWLLVAVIIGVGYGFIDTWIGSGNGGPFGWGPGSLG